MRNGRSHLGSGGHAALFEPMSPTAFSPFDGMPGCCALARDKDFRLVWCNQAYADYNEKKSPEDLHGLTMRDLMPPDLAADREDAMRPALEEGRTVAYQQMWKGVRWLTRVWPLDPEAFGHPGYFVVMNVMTAPLPPEERPDHAVQFIRTADLGDLSVLTPRELEVFYYLAAGMTVSDTADSLFRSEKTIGRHVENIHRKMGYTSRAELVRDAVERGLVAFTGQEWLALTDPKRTKPEDQPSDQMKDQPKDPTQDQPKK